LEVSALPIEVIPHVEFLEAGDLPSKIRDLSLELTDVKIAAAYIREKGFRLLAPSLQLSSVRKFADSKLRIKLLFGLSERQFITDHEPLRKLLNIRAKLGFRAKKLQLRYYNDARFHPKMLILTNGERAALFVGSSNITKGGLKSNKEANLLLEAESGNKAVQDASTFFDQLWKNANKLTAETLEIYRKDKEEYEKKKLTQPTLGRLPRGGLPAGALPRKKELYLYIEGVRYPLSKIHSFCTKCGRPTVIPMKWLEWWKCEKHGTGRYVLKKRAKTAISLAYSGRKIRDVEEVEGDCLYRFKNGRICSERFSLKADFSHQICRRCYENREKEGAPHSRIPRTLDRNESFFYDVDREAIITRS